MKKILIPTDGSQLGDYAYNLAHDIANRTAAEIIILSIVPAPPNTFFSPDGELKQDEGEDFSDLFQYRDDLQKVMENWSKEKPDISQVEVKIGRVDEDIVQCVKDHGIDLVVMGTTGAYGVKEFIQGSHAVKIVRNSPAPVLTLKCDRSNMTVKDLLLAGDFEKPERLDLTVVKELQKAYRANLHLLSVNTPGNFFTTRAIEEQMKQFVDINELEEVNMHVYCAETVEEGLVHFSEDTGIDFLMMGTHQRKGLGRLFKKSISESVVNHIWQPVLTFHV